MYAFLILTIIEFINNIIIEWFYKDKEAIPQMGFEPMTTVHVLALDHTKYHVTLPTHPPWLGLLYFTILRYR